MLAVAVAVLVVIPEKDLPSPLPFWLSSRRGICVAVAVAVALALVLVLVCHSERSEEPPHLLLLLLLLLLLRLLLLSLLPLHLGRPQNWVPHISILQIWAFAKAIRYHPSLSQRQSVSSSSISNASAAPVPGQWQTAPRTVPASSQSPTSGLILPELG